MMIGPQTWTVQLIQRYRCVVMSLPVYHLWQYWPVIIIVVEIDI